VTQDDPRPGVKFLSLITVTVISDDARACITGSGEGRHRNSGDLRRKSVFLAITEVAEVSTGEVSKNRCPA
jgi:hypothetical protein